MAVQKYEAGEIPWVVGNTGHHGFGVFLGFYLLVDCGNDEMALIRATTIAEALTDFQPVPEFYKDCIIASREPIN